MNLNAYIHPKENLCIMRIIIIYICSTKVKSEVELVKNLMLLSHFYATKKVCTT